MISINGRTFRGNNVTIINGKVINGGDSISSKKFDDRKEENARNVEKITIDSSIADVDVSVSNSEKVEAHFFGEASIDGGIHPPDILCNWQCKAPRSRPREKQST